MGITFVLKNLITDAQELLNNAVIGEGFGEYPQQGKDELLTAIAAAQAVLDDEDATEDEINAAVEALQQAIEEFLASVVVDKTILGKEINDIQAILQNAVVGDGYGEYTQDAKDELSGVFEDAQGILDATQEVIDAAVEGLKAALIKFEASNPGNPEKYGYVISFQDEFNDPELDDSKWINRYLGFRVPEDKGRANYVLEDGILKLRVDEENPERYSPSHSMRVSSLQTAQIHMPREISPYYGMSAHHHEDDIINFAQQYGYFEIRARVPYGPGHSAFWTYPADTRYYITIEEGGKRVAHNEPFEIDIFEIGRGVGFYNQPINHHPSGPKHGAGLPFDSTEDFHVYALEWNEDYLIFYTDGVEIFRSKNVPHFPHFFLLGLYIPVEGESMWSGNWTRGDEELYPFDFEIDYFRAYKRPGTATVRAITGDELDNNNWHWLQLDTIETEQSIELSYGSDIPVVEVTNPPVNGTVNITQAVEFPGSATVELIEEDGETYTHTINFVLAPPQTDILE